MWHERRREEVHTWLWGGNLKERHHLEDLDVDGGDKIGMDFEEIRWEVTEWMDRAQSRGKWRVLVNAGMNFWVRVS
jgi:hypothetical protein